MTALLWLGIVVAFVGAVTLWVVPVVALPWLWILGVTGAAGALLAGAGALFAQGGRPRQGARLGILGGVLALPFGVVALAAAVRLLQQDRLGTLVTAAPRQGEMLRPLRHAMVIFMGVAVVAWVASLILLRQGAAETLEQAMWPVAAVAVALVAGLEAFYLWTRRNDEAFRLGMWGAALALLALAVAALYLHSYFAVALLGLPAYLMVLLLQGRRGDGSLQRHRAKKRGAPLAVENHGR